MVPCMTHQRRPGYGNTSDPHVVTITLTDHQYDLFPTVSVQVDVDTVGGTHACLARWERDRDDLDRISQVLADLGDAFLWGDGLKAIIATVQTEDRSAQSRRVRRSLVTE